MQTPVISTNYERVIYIHYCVHNLSALYPHHVAMSQKQQIDCVKNKNTPRVDTRQLREISRCCPVINCAWRLN